MAAGLRIGMPSLGIHLLSLEELYPEVQSVSQSYHYVYMTESEYVAATHTAKEALGLPSLIKQLFDKLSPTTMFSNNQSAIVLAKDHQYHTWTKHADICYHFIHWIVERGLFD